jgi:hypothetical protein
MLCVESIPEYIKEQPLTRMKCSEKFALQIDELTEVAGLAQLLLFVTYSFYEKIQGEFMFFQLLSERCTGIDIFQAVNDCFTAEDIFWVNCISICTDEAAALTGHKVVQAEVQQVGPHMNSLFIEKF